MHRGKKSAYLVENVPNLNVAALKPSTMGTRHTWPHCSLHHHQLWLYYFWCSIEIKTLREKWHVWLAVPREKNLRNYWNCSAEILRNKVHLQWIPWSGDSRFIIVAITIQVIFFIPWKRRKKNWTERISKTPEFRGFLPSPCLSSSNHMHRALTFLFEIVLKHFFFCQYHTSF